MLNWRDGLPLLVTPRVVLRELRRADAAALAGVARADGGRHGWAAPASVDAFEAFITAAWRERGDGRYACFAVVPRDQAEPAGLFELRSLQPQFFRAELTLFLHPAAWGTPAFDDGLRLICGFSFQTVGVHRIEMRTLVSHARAQMALEALGVCQEAVLRAAVERKGRFEDQYLWSIVKGLDALAGACEDAR